MTDRTHWPDLFRLGWPVSATMLVRVSMRTVDLLVVGMVVGAVGVSALGIGDAAARIVLMTALGLGAGTIATVSQHVGAGRRRDADIATTQSALLAAVIGAPLAVIGWYGAPAFFSVLGASADVADLGVPYMQIVLLTAPARMVAVMLTRALQGAGDTRTPLVIRTVGTVLNIVLTVALVPGVGPLPELGVTGAAIGTAVGNVISALMLTGWLAHGGGAVGLARAGLTAFGVGRTIVRIGLPQVAERNLFALGVIPLNAITLAFGTAANAGMQVGRRVMLYALLPSRGVATAASTRVGNSVGADSPEEAGRRARSAISLSVTVTVPVAAALLVWARPVSQLFIQEADALAMAADWVRVYAIVTIVRAVYGVLRDSLQGAGDTRPPLVAGAVGVLGFTVGFSWLVGIVLGVGLVGVYAGVLLDAVVRTGILLRVFLAGRWLRRSVVEPAPTGQA